MLLESDDSYAGKMPIEVSFEVRVGDDDEYQYRYCLVITSESSSRNAPNFEVQKVIVITVDLVVVSIFDIFRNG